MTPNIRQLVKLARADAIPPIDCENSRVITRQRGNTGTLMFSFARILAYISTFTTLEPGDLIATGTPPGAGGRFDPPKWLKPGDVVDVACDQIGTLRNSIVDEVAG